MCFIVPELVLCVLLYTLYCSGMCRVVIQDVVVMICCINYEVWDVRRDLLVAVYGEHFGRLLSVEWSATDADILLTGSDDHSVHVWRISRHRWNDSE